MQATAKQVADYVHTHLQLLEKMVQEVELSDLAYLIGMAKLEPFMQAQTEIKNHIWARSNPNQPRE